MRQTRVAIIFIAILCMGLLSACSDSVPLAPPTPTPFLAGEPTRPASTPAPSLAPTVAATQVSGNLAEALAFAPSGIQQVFYTDWALLGTRLGRNVIESSTPDDDRHFLRAMSDHIPASNFPSEALSSSWRDNPSDGWVLSILDYTWSANFLSSNSVDIQVLRFRPDFDLAPLLTQLSDRNYTSKSYQGVSIYSHPFYPDDKQWLSQHRWLRNTTFQNIALIREEGILILSRNLEHVENALDARFEVSASLLDDKASLSMASHLGESASVLIYLGEYWERKCASRPGSSFSSLLQISSPEDAKLATVVAGMKLHDYISLGLGYGPGDEDGDGVIVMHYKNAEDAKADLQPRLQIAELGPTRRISQPEPYSKFAFTVQNAEVSGSDLVMRLKTVYGRSGLLINLVMQNLMQFTECP